MPAPKFLRRTMFSLAVSSLFSSAVFAEDATIQNASFSTFIVASDSFPSWNADKDSTGGARFTITQDTAGAYSAPGCLKMAIAAGADSSTKCNISTSITGLAPNKIVTISAMVKYTNMPTYWNGLFNFQQATLSPVTYAWKDRKWTSGWGNGLGTSDWVPASMTDTTADSANVFNFIISLSKAGTLWVDDITVTYTDNAPVLSRAAIQNRQSSFRNNRVSFSRPMPYSLKVCGVNGKVLLQKSGTSALVDVNRIGLTSGAYLVSVKTAERTFSGRVMLGR